MIALISFQNPISDSNGVACHIKDLFLEFSSRKMEAVIVHPYNSIFNTQFLFKKLLRFATKIYKLFSFQIIFYIKINLLISILKIKIKNLPNNITIINAHDIISLIAMKESIRKFPNQIYTLHANFEPDVEFIKAGYFRKDSFFFKLFQKRCKLAYQIPKLKISYVSNHSKILYETKMNPDFKSLLQDTKIIDLGVDVHFVKSNTTLSDIRSKGDYIINIGKVCEIKNQFRLAELALEFIRQGENINFVIIGEIEPDYHKKMISFLEENNMLNNFSFLGKLSRNQVFQWVSHAKFNIHTAVMESFGLCVIESMALGCPIFAFDYPALRSIFSTTPEAILYSKEKNSSIVQKIRQMRTKDNNFYLLSKKQKKEYESKYQVSVMVNNIMNFYCKEA